MEEYWGFLPITTSNINILKFTFEKDMILLHLLLIKLFAMGHPMRTKNERTPVVLLFFMRGNGA